MPTFQPGAAEDRLEIGLSHRSKVQPGDKVPAAQGCGPARRQSWGQAHLHHSSGKEQGPGLSLNGAPGLWAEGAWAGIPGGAPQGS